MCVHACVCARVCAPVCACMCVYVCVCTHTYTGTHAFLRVCVSCRFYMCNKLTWPVFTEPCLNVHLHDIVTGKYKNAVYAKYEAHRENGKGEWVRNGESSAVFLCTMEISPPPPPPPTPPSAPRLGAKRLASYSEEDDSLEGNVCIWSFSGTHKQTCMHTHRPDITTLVDWA